MKDKTIKIIITITAISLVGLISMQLYWIFNAFTLSGQQYDHRVTIAIKDAIRDIEKYNLGQPDSTKGSCYFPCGEYNTEPEFIQTDLLDSLLKVHFIYNNLDTVYDFAIVKSKNDSLLFKKKKLASNTPCAKGHKIGLSCVKYSGSFDLEVHFPKKNQFIILQMLSWLIISVLFLTIIIISFSYIIIVIIKQKKISEMKNDFINNMTHELKTPISTISMASEVLLKVDSGLAKERIEKYARIINDENHRLHLLVDRVLRISELENKEYSLHKEKTDLHETIKIATSQMCLEQMQKPVKLKLNLNASRHIAFVDKFHFTNIINNLVENACKYSTENPEIIISSSNIENGIQISIKDNGIGITKEQQKLIFEKFYRVHTGDIHDVKGFGLGLYYVKTLVELHNGSINIKSEPGNLPAGRQGGSEFSVFFPLPSNE